MKVVVLINPVSGPGTTARTGAARAAEASAQLTSAGVDHLVHVSRGPGHLFELAAQAAAGDADRVCAWGGDGTMNEVGRALAFTRTAMAIVPAGSGNGLARALGVPSRAARALQLAVTATPRAIDAGEIGGHLFFNVAGVGFDGVIAHAFGRGSHRRGLREYIRLVGGELLQYKPRRYTLHFNGARIDRQLLLIACANGPQWGNGARIAPRASLDDGLLDIVMAETSSAWRMVRHIPRLFTGTADRAAGVTTIRTAELSIAGDAPLCAHADGEPLPTASSELTVRVRPRALLVCGAQR